MNLYIVQPLILRIGQAGAVIESLFFNRFTAPHLFRGDKKGDKNKDVNAQEQEREKQSAQFIPKFKAFKSKKRRGRRKEIGQTTGNRKETRRKNIAGARKSRN